jgi:hypothetical protein
MAKIHLIVHIIFTFSQTVAEYIGLVALIGPLHDKALTSVPQPFSSAKTIFTGIGLLLGAGLLYFLDVYPYNTPLMQ